MKYFPDDKNPERINAYGMMALNFQLNKAKAPQVSDTTGDAICTNAHQKILLL